MGADEKGLNPKVAKLLDNFVVFGNFGKHYVMVFEVLGMCSNDLLKDFEDGLPVAMVKSVIKDFMEGLQFLHDEAGIIHSDIKPENLLFSRTKEINEEELSLVHKHYLQKADKKSLQEAQKKLERSTGL